MGPNRGLQIGPGFGQILRNWETAESRPKDAIRETMESFRFGDGLLMDSDLVVRSNDSNWVPRSGTQIEVFRSGPGFGQILRNWETVESRPKDAIRETMESFRFW